MISRRLPQTGSRLRAGFTLVELLIVIVIIGILMAFLVPAVTGIKQNVKDAQIKNDIEALSRAIADFKGEFGVEPPSSILLFERGAEWNSYAANQNERKRSRAAIRSMWPGFNFNIDRDIDGDGMVGNPVQLTGAECLAFFLGGMYDAGKGQMIGFSKNSNDPFSRAGSNRQGPYYADFSPSRLSDVDRDNMPELLDPRSDQVAPYIYATSYGGRGYRNADLNLGGGQGMNSVYLEQPTGPAWNAQGFQIISPGADGEYGTGGRWTEDTADSDLTGGRDAERDNITNFTSGRLAT